MNTFVLFQSSLIPLLLITSILSINFQSSVCADTAEYGNCSQPITCGSVNSSISYPFWGGNRPKYCGKSGFETTCSDDDVPMITMKDITFRLLDMNNSNTTTTVTVARNDYWDSLCPSKYITTDLNYSLFDYASGPQNLSFYYGCSFPTTIASPITGFNISAITRDCSSSVTVSFLTAKQAAQIDTNTLKTTICPNLVLVLVPVSASAADALDKNQTTTIQAAVNGGFELNVQNVDTDLCNNCVASRGFCGQNTTTLAFICYCQNGTSTTTCDSISATPNSENKKKLKLAIGLASGVVGMVVLVLVIHCCLRRKLSSIFFWKKQNQNCKNLEAFLSKFGPFQVKKYSYLDVKKMTNSFEEKLGQGGYGGVYKGKLKSGPLVAVKVLNRSKGNGEDFMNEVSAISRTSHVNIVSLLGFCFEGSKRALVYEFMPNGSLEKFIFDASNSQEDRHLGWEALLQISLGIARGLEYLHRGCNTRIVHFDIKPHNILLDENFLPKISDFGLAKVCDRKESIVSMLYARGTVGYIAPEVFCRSFGGVSHKSDVYSYGMMLSEMARGRRKINIEAENTSEIYFPHWIYNRLELDEDLDLDSIKSEEDKARARKVIIVSLWCIQTDPSNRPAMKEVIEMLEGSVESLKIPPKPYLSSPPKSPAVVDSSSTLVSIQ